MISNISINKNISSLFSQPEISKKITASKSIVIKINLAKPPQENHPRTDPILLKAIINHLISMNKKVIICESADGFLEENLNTIGLQNLISNSSVIICDLDKEQYQIIFINKQKILVPQILIDADLRISIPCCSKRENHLFSCNIKNFFGATPRIGYMKEEGGRSRLKLHEDLTSSILNVFEAFQTYAKFNFYINGGNAFVEGKGLFNFDKIYISDDAIELDNSIFEKYFYNCEKPEYLTRLEERFNKVIL